MDSEKRVLVCVCVREGESQQGHVGVWRRQLGGQEG